MEKAPTKRIEEALRRRQRPDPWYIPYLEEAKAQTHRYPGAAHRSFTDREEAERYLAGDENLGQKAWKVEPLSGPSLITPPCSIPELEIKQHEESKGAVPGNIDHEPGLPLSPLPYDQFYKKAMDNIRKIHARLMKAYKPKPEFADTPDDIIAEDLPPLSSEQASVYSDVMKGLNVFITGSAGTGKSLLLKHIKIGLAHKKKKYQVTAPTGMAAVQVDGRTFYSWARIGTGQCGLDALLEGLMTNPVNGWTDIDVLIIDEISMVHADLFQTLDRLARVARRIDEPFGGIRIVVCGDFFQLPPINRRTCYKCGSILLQPRKRAYYSDPSILTIPRHHFYKSNGVAPDRWTVCTYRDPDDPKSPPCHHPYNDTAVFAFQAPAWTEAKFHTRILSKVFRQTDEKWIQALQELKTGRCKPYSPASEFIYKLQRSLKPPGDLLPTKLYTHRLSVDDENLQKYRELLGEEFVVPALDEGEIWVGNEYHATMSRQQRERHDYFRYLQAPVTLRLKEKAQVMYLINNRDKEIYNGSRGVVEGFAKINLENPEEIIPWKRGELKFLSSEEMEVTVPLVRFYDNKRPTELRSPIAIKPHKWTNCLRYPNGITHSLSRTQIPLTLAWAATIHKSQGQTLDYAVVDIGSSFTAGQAYVGVSRCRSPEAMQVLLGRKRLGEIFTVDENVVEFYRGLDGAEAVLGPLARKTEDEYEVE